MKLAVVFLIASCGVTTPAPSSAAAPSRIVENFPVPTLDVVPAELGDPGVLDRIRARAVVRLWCVVSIGDELVGSDTEHCRDTNTYDVAAVIDYDDDEFRVVVEQDNARYAAGIMMPLVMRTVLAPTTIGSVTVTPGVALHSNKSGARGLSFRDSHLVVENLKIPAERVGRVFAAQPGDSPPVLGVRTGTRWSPPRDARPRVVISEYSIIRDRPGYDATQIAQTDDADRTLATKLGAASGWTEIEVHRPHIRVRGFVDDSDLIAGDELDTITTGGGTGYGISHATKHQLPAGTCLYDKIDGRVIGVTLEARERLGQSAVNGWANVYVGTPWARATMVAKDLAADLAQPRWETCTPSPGP